MLCVRRITNIGFVQCFSLGSLLRLYAYVSRFVMRTSPHKLRVCAAFAPRFPLEICTDVFVCFACFASQTPGLYSAFPSAPFDFARLCLSSFVMRTSPHKHQFCAVLFSRLPFNFTRLYWSCFFVRVFIFTWFCGIRLLNAGFVVVAGCF